MAKKITKIADLTLDRKNANRGTPRGQKMLEGSLSTYGAGRSVVADKDGRIIAGNQTVNAAREMGMPIRVIPTDGSELVVVQRTDLDLEDDPENKARELAYADNRTGQVNLDFNPLRLADDLSEGVDLSKFWNEDELQELLAEAEPGDGGVRGGNGLGNPIVQYQIVFSTEDQQTRFHRFVRWLRENFGGDTIADRLDAFLQARVPEALGE